MKTADRRRAFHCALASALVLLAIVQSTPLALHAASVLTEPGIVGRSVAEYTAPKGCAGRQWIRTQADGEKPRHTCVDLDLRARNG